MRYNLLIQTKARQPSRRDKMTAIQVTEKQLAQVLFNENQPLELSIVLPTLERTVKIHKNIVALKQSGALAVIEPIYTHEHMYFMVGGLLGRKAGISETPFELRFVHNVNFSHKNIKNHECLFMEYMGMPYVHAYQNGHKVDVSVILNTGEIYGLKEYFDLKRINILSLIGDLKLQALDQAKSQRLDE